MTANSANKRIIPLEEGLSDIKRVSYWLPRLDID